MYRRERLIKISDEQIKKRVEAYIEINIWFKETYGVSIASMVAMVNLQNFRTRTTYRKLYKEYYDSILTDSQKNFGKRKW